jgi:hypothetical protein
VILPGVELIPDKRIMTQVDVIGQMEGAGPSIMVGTHRLE